MTTWKAIMQCKTELLNAVHSTTLDAVQRQQYLKWCKQLVSLEKLVWMEAHPERTPYVADTVVLDGQILMLQSNYRGYNKYVHPQKFDPQAYLKYGDNVAPVPRFDRIHSRFALIKYREPNYNEMYEETAAIVAENNENERFKVH